LNNLLFTSTLISILFFALGSVFFIFFHAKVKPNSNLLELFFSQLFFILALISVYAIISAPVNTIFLLLPALLFFIWRQLPFKLRTNRDFSGKLIFAPLSLLVLVCVCNCFIVFPNSIEKDVIYYSKIASHLRDYGTENYYHFYNNLFDHNVGLTPYHYTELWLTAFVSLVFNVKSIIALKFIVYPYLLTVGLTGIMGLVEVLSHKKAGLPLGLFILASLLLFGFFGSVFSFKSSGWDIVFSPWLRPNFILYILGIVPVIYSLQISNYRLLMLFFILTCFLSFTVIPAVLISALLLLVYLLFMRQIVFKELLVCAGILTFGLISYYCFYFLNKSNVRLNGSRTTLEIIMYSFSIWKATLVAYVNLSMRFIIFLPVFYVLAKKKMLQLNIVVYMYLLILSSIGAFQLLSQMDNSYQIPHLGFVTFAVLILIISGFYFTKATNLLVKLSVIACLFLLGLFVKTADWHFIKGSETMEDFYISKNGMGADFAKLAVKQMQNKSDLFGFFLDKEQMHEKEFRYLTELTIQPTLGLSYLTDNNNAICINNKIDFFENSKGRGREIIDFWYSDMFDLYCHKDNPMDYISENKIRGFFITKNGILEQQIDLTNKGVKFIEDQSSDWVLIYR
jgi:hypothetical protein